MTDTNKLIPSAWIEELIAETATPVAAKKTGYFHVAVEVAPEVIASVAGFSADSVVVESSGVWTFDDDGNPVTVHSTLDNERLTSLISTFLSNN